MGAKRQVNQQYLTALNRPTDPRGYVEGSMAEEWKNIQYAYVGLIVYSAADDKYYKITETNDIGDIVEDCYEEYNPVKEDIRLLVGCVDSRDFTENVCVRKGANEEAETTYPFRSTHKYRVDKGQKISIDYLYMNGEYYGLIKYDSNGNIVGGEASGSGAEDMIHLYEVEEGVSYVRFTAYTDNVANFKNIRITNAENVDCNRLEPYFTVKTITHDGGGDSEMNYNAFVGSVLYDSVLYIFYMKGVSHASLSAKIVYKFTTDGGETWSSENDLLTNVSSCIPSALGEGTIAKGGFCSLIAFKSGDNLYGICDFRYEHSSGAVFKKNFCYRFGKGSDNKLSIEKKVLAPSSTGNGVMFYVPSSATNQPSSMVSSNVIVEGGYMYWVQYNSYNMYMQKMAISVIDNEAIPSSSNSGLVHAWLSADNFSFTESALIKKNGILYCVVRREFKTESVRNKVMGSRLYYSKDMGVTWKEWKDVLPLDKPFALDIPNSSDVILLGRCKNPNWYGQEHYTTLNVVSANMDIKLKAENYNVGGYICNDSGYESAEIVGDNLLIFYYSSVEGHVTNISDIKMSKIPLSAIKNAL